MIKQSQLNRVLLSAVSFVLIFVVVCAAGASLTYGAPSPHATTTYPWTMSRHDAQNTAFSSSPAPKTLISTWNFAADAYPYFSTPVVSNGILYFVGVNGNLYALNASTGTAIRNFTLGNFVGSSVAVANGKIFIGMSNGTVLALNANDFSRVWNYTTGGILVSSPVVADSKVFIGSTDKNMYALDENTGAKIWSYTTGGLIYTSAAVGDGKVFFASGNGYVWCLNENNGNYVWAKNISTSSSQLWSSPAFQGDKVFVGSLGTNKTYALNKDTGAIVWDFDMGGQVWAAPAVAYGKVFVGSLNNKTYAIYQANGTVAWEYTTTGPVVFGCAVADNAVFLSTNDKKFYALDANTGVKLWDFTAANFFSTCPAIADGLVYIGSMDNVIHAFGTPYVPTVIQPSLSIPLEYIIIAVVAAAAAILIILFLMKRKPKVPKPPPPPKPASLRIASTQSEVFADGSSSIDLSVELLDQNGNPIATDSDREVFLSATDGKIAGSVIIPKGKPSTKAMLTSSTKVGAVTVSATLKELAGAQLGVNFTEKKRYCMICGQRMPVDARVCPSCGNVPPSGADTKACKNCGAVIPIVAKFCKECGASQPV